MNMERHMQFRMQLAARRTGRSTVTVIILFLMFISMARFAPNSMSTPAAAASEEPAPAQRRIAVMSFNLRTSGFTDENGWTRTNVAQEPQRREVAIDILDRYRPDVIGFQEPRFDQLEDLDANLPTSYDSVRILGSGGATPPNEFAAIYYRVDRLTVVDWGFFALGDSPGPGHANSGHDAVFDPLDLFDGTDQRYPRIALWAQFMHRTSGQPFFFYTTHYDFTDDAQLAATELIIEDMKTRTAREPRAAPVVIVGDFNAHHERGAWQLFTGVIERNGTRGDFGDAWAQTHSGFEDAGTFHGFDGGVRPAEKRFDWVLYRGGIVATNCTIITDATEATVSDGGNSHTRVQYPSDHYPLLATLTLPYIPDMDQDGLPDALELQLGTDPANPDTDGDGAPDGVDDRPTVPGEDELPGREFLMDGWLDTRVKVLDEHGLTLWADYNGRELYFATEDTGEGSDHFIFLCEKLDTLVDAPWDKDGEVYQWTAFLAGENDNRFAGWFDEDGAPLEAADGYRARTFFINYGVLEGVVDLHTVYGRGAIPNEFYIAVAPYESADGTGTCGDGIGELLPDAQVPAGTTEPDRHLNDPSEYYRFDLRKFDTDGDGIADERDIDADGSGLPDVWERWYGVDDPDADPDDDGLSNRAEFGNGTDPNVGDTDGDTMPDGYEVRYGLDPLVPSNGTDTDGDGICDRDEYLAGSNPLVAEETNTSNSGNTSNNGNTSTSEVDGNNTSGNTSSGTGSDDDANQSQDQDQDHEPDQNHAQNDSTHPVGDDDSETDTDGDDGDSDSDSDSDGEGGSDGNDAEAEDGLNARDADAGQGFIIGAVGALTAAITIVIVLIVLQQRRRH